MDAFVRLSLKTCIAGHIRKYPVRISAGKVQRAINSHGFLIEFLVKLIIK